MELTLLQICWPKSWLMSHNFPLHVKMAYHLFLTYSLEFLFSCHEQELTSFYHSFDKHQMFWQTPNVLTNTKCFDKCESTWTDSNYVWIFWIWVWKDWVWKVHGYNCIRNKQSFLSHYSNIFQFCPSNCFLCCQSLHDVVQNESYLSEKDFLTLLPTYSP